MEKAPVQLLKIALSIFLIIGKFKWLKTITVKVCKLKQTRCGIVWAMSENKIRNDVMLFVQIKT